MTYQAFFIPSIPFHPLGAELRPLISIDEAEMWVGHEALRHPQDLEGRKRGERFTVERYFWIGIILIIIVVNVDRFWSPLRSGRPERLLAYLRWTIVFGTSSPHHHSNSSCPWFSMFLMLIYSHKWLIANRSPYTSFSSTLQCPHSLPTAILYCRHYYSRPHYSLHLHPLTLSSRSNSLRLYFRKKQRPLFWKMMRK